MNRLVIIPARGGSKRFPSKNVAKLHGRPMLFHTVEAALGLFDKILITSDSPNILQLAEDEYGDYSAQNEGEIEFSKRPDELATDASKVIDTICHYFDLNSGFDQIWMMLPTCPLRTREDVSAAQGMLVEGVDSVISVTEYEFPPSLGLLMGAQGDLVAYDASDPWRKGNSRSQDHQTVLRPNGALYGMWWKSFDEQRNFYKGRVRGHFMPRERSVDVDTRVDFMLAQTLLNERAKGPH
jgi:N-acylneuraminate cytidylyltransferase